MDHETQAGDGLLAAVKRVAGTARRTLESRVELFLLEAKEDRLKLFEAICLAIVAVGLALMALVLVTFTIVVIFWDTYRLTAMVTLSVLYTGLSAVTFMKLRTLVKNWRSFPATLEQLEKDRECFKPRS